MNLKKILILPVSFLITNVMYVACCDCTPSNKHYYQVENLLLKPLGSNNIVVDTGSVVNMDSLYLDCLFFNNCVAQNKNNFSFLINTASACKCNNNCGDEGLKSKLTSVLITSNNIYNNIPANTPLNSFFKTYDKYNTRIGANVSVDSAINLINLSKTRVSDFNLYTKTKPGNALAQKLNIKATFANGTTFSAETKAIFWQ